MGETLGAHIQFSVTVVLTAMLIVNIVHINAISLSSIEPYIDRIVSAADTAVDAEIVALSGEQQILAATVYRVIEQNVGSVNSLQIIWADGTITSDYNSLLKQKPHAYMNVRVEYNNHDGSYKLTIREVA